MPNVTNQINKILRASAADGSMFTTDGCLRTRHIALNGAFSAVENANSVLRNTQIPFNRRRAVAAKFLADAKEWRVFATQASRSYNCLVAGGPW